MHGLRLCCSAWRHGRRLRQGAAKELQLQQATENDDCSLAGQRCSLAARPQHAELVCVRQQLGQAAGRGGRGGNAENEIKSNGQNRLIEFSLFSSMRAEAYSAAPTTTVACMPRRLECRRRVRCGAIY